MPRAVTTSFLVRLTCVSEVMRQMPPNDPKLNRAGQLTQELKRGIFGRGERQSALAPARCQAAWIHKLLAKHLARIDRWPLVHSYLHALASVLVTKLLRLSPATRAFNARRRCKAGSTRTTNLPLNFFPANGPGRVCPSFSRISRTSSTAWQSSAYTLASSWPWMPPYMR